MREISPAATPRRVQMQIIQGAVWSHLSRSHPKKSPAAMDTAEPTRVITVRLPKSMHDALKDEAYEHRTSMNKLCISKLLQFIDGQQVPPEG